MLPTQILNICIEQKKSLRTFFLSEMEGRDCFEYFGTQQSAMTLNFTTPSPTREFRMMFTGANASYLTRNHCGTNCKCPDQQAEMISARVYQLSGLILLPL